MVCFCGGREPGCAPGGAPSFLVSPRKVGKRRRPYCLRPLRCATGQPGVLGCGVRRVTHCAPAALRSDKRGESVHEACARGRACHPASTPPQAQPARGGERTASRAIAALGLACQREALAPAKTRPSAAMARVVVGRQPPLLVAPAARRGWRIRARDCLSAAGASSSETPPAPSTAGCGLLGSDTHFTAVRSTAPSGRAEGSVNWGSDPNNPSQTAGSPFFWVRFFGEAKKSTSPAGARPGLRPQQGNTPRSAQGFDKLNPTG